MVDMLEEKITSFDCIKTLLKNIILKLCIEFVPIKRLIVVKKSS